MIVCLCHRVSDRDITRAVKSGCRCFADLQGQTHVGTGCGTCLACARAHFDDQLRLCEPAPNALWAAAACADQARPADPPAALVPAP